MPISKRPKAPVNYTECNDSELDDDHIPIAKTSILVQSDSDCDSPGDAQQPSKKRGTLLAYARPGIDNTIISEPREARGQGISGKITKRTRKRTISTDSSESEHQEDVIEDSEADDRRLGKPVATRRPRAAAAGQKTYRVPEESSASSEEDEDDIRAQKPTRNVDSAGHSGSEMELDDAAEPTESESGDEEEEEEEEEENQEDDASADDSDTEIVKQGPAQRRARRRLQNPFSKFAQGATAAEARLQRQRAPRRAAVAKPVYDEDALFERHFGSSDSSDEDIEEGGSDADLDTRKRTRASRHKRHFFDSDAENRPPQRRSTRAARRPSIVEDEDELSSEHSDDDRARNEPKAARGSRTATLSEAEAWGEEEDERMLSASNDGETSSAEGEDSDSNEHDSEAAMHPMDAAAAVEKILASRSFAFDLADDEERQRHVKEQEEEEETEFRIKLVGRSYRFAPWVPRSALLAVGRSQLVRSFEKRQSEGAVDPYGDLDDGVHPDWVCIDRVVAAKEATARLPAKYLVKWRGLGYSEATWESEAALQREEADKAAIERYRRFSQRYESTMDDEDEEDEEDKAVDTSCMPTFCNARQLRDYQRQSLAWMAANWARGRNCILGDEMGLGKTAQSIACLAFQQQIGKAKGAFLVVAPLTTLGHWQREIETWTDMDCVVYAGSADDRALAQLYELWPRGRGRRGCRRIKPDVVLASYETVLRDAGVFQSIEWESVVIDEAHRMKGTGSATRAALAGCSYGWLLLLTGTPVQNNVRELFGLLNLLDPEEYSSETAFLERFGDDSSAAGVNADQVRALQAVLRPILLRRMKEDVENLPEKEECIIWTQLTAEQRQYYRAIFERRIGTLMAGTASKNAPQLRNVAMELRKVCCHPFLCEGVEEDYAARRAANGVKPTDDLEAIVQSSGKMLLLHKLLPKLRAEGHKALIFSQFKIMLDVLEDYMRLAGFPCERIDGSTSSRDRQAAIDRYSKPDSDGFVFLLSTRAGGQGITLTAADTCIIYDSDWNPQNDLQAMARCHRIGQEKEVTIYRLVSKDTYEEHVFFASSRKYGLDEAILGGIGSGRDGASAGAAAAGKRGGGGDPEADTKRIADLLKHGAHCLTADEIEASAKETEAFANEDIDAILNGRTEKRQIGGRAGNTFSVATFNVAQGGGSSGTDTGKGGEADDKAFWAALLPEAARAEEEKKAAGPLVVIEEKRRRKRVNYAEHQGKRAKRRGSSSGGSPPSSPNGDSDFDVNKDGNDSDASGFSDGKDRIQDEAKPHKKAAKEQHAQGTKRARAPSGVWLPRHVEAVLDGLLRFGFWRHKVVAKHVAEKLPVSLRETKDIPGMAVLLRHLLDLAAKHFIEYPGMPIQSAEKELERVCKNPPSGMSSLNTETLRGMLGQFAQSMYETSARMHQEYDRKVDALVRVMAEAALPPKASDLPDSAVAAVLSPEILRRLIRNAHVYHQHARAMERLRMLGVAAFKEEEEEAFHRALVAAHLVPPSVGMAAKALARLGWQALTHDAALLKGCLVLGFGGPGSRSREKDVEHILRDPRFGFRRLFRHPDDVEEGITSAPPPPPPHHQHQQPPSTGSLNEGDHTMVGGSAASASVFSPPSVAVLVPNDLKRVKDAAGERLKALLAAVAGPDTLVKNSPDARLFAKQMEELAQKIGCNVSSSDQVTALRKAASLFEEQRCRLRMALNYKVSRDQTLDTQGMVKQQHRSSSSASDSSSSDSDSDPIEDADADEKADMASSKLPIANPVPSAQPASILPRGGRGDIPDGHAATTSDAQAQAQAGLDKPTGGEATPNLLTTPALNVFEETRGKFTDPGCTKAPEALIANASGVPSGGGAGPSRLAAGGSSKLHGAVSKDKLAMRRSKLSKASSSMAAGMRQASLFDMKKVTRIPRTTPEREAGVDPSPGQDGGGSRPAEIGARSGASLVAGGNGKGEVINLLND